MTSIATATDEAVDAMMTIAVCSGMETGFEERALELNMGPQGLTFDVKWAGVQVSPNTFLGYDGYISALNIVHSGHGLAVVLTSH